MPALLGRNVCRHRAVNVRGHFLPADKPSYEAARAANGADGNADRAACACLPAETRSQAQKPAQTLQRRAWQPVLESLSRATPSQVWLTELRYQPPALMLTGYAITLPALSVLRDALGQIAGFTPGTAGELRQDSQGAGCSPSILKRGVTHGYPVRTLVRKPSLVSGAFLVSGELLAGLAAWGTLLRPLDRQCAERQRQMIQDARTNAALWPAVRKVPFRTETTDTRR